MTYQNMIHRFNYQKSLEAIRKGIPFLYYTDDEAKEVFQMNSIQAKMKWHILKNSMPSKGSYIWTTKFYIDLIDECERIFLEDKR